ncbi:hypothetical protein QFZ27_005931 [Inquilinus ginsengisoli]|uniref:hypothetical protein n=1 Tax=Inquilinus ginsengisoli TaxID=363840 RepID=UPI003D1CA7CA
MKPSLLLVAAFGLALPAHAQAPAYHVQLQVNATTVAGGGSCRIGTGVIGTYPDSPGRLAIGTPVDLFIPCGTAGAPFFEARLVGGPGGLQPDGPGALRPLATPVALPNGPAAPSLVPPSLQFQPQPRQVLIAPTTPVTPWAASPVTAPRVASPFTAPRVAPQPMLPLPANPVAASRPLVIQGAAPVVVVGTPGTVYTPAPSPAFARPLPPPVPAPQGGDTATMRPDAAIVLSFGPVSAARAGTPHRVVLPTDPSYPALLTQLGGIAPGQTKALPR